MSQATTQQLAILRRSITSPPVTSSACRKVANENVKQQTKRTAGYMERQSESYR